MPPVASVREQAAKELAGYYAMVENIDQNVGRIVDCLNEAGLMDHTHIIFFSDHGDMHGSHGQFRKTTPYQEAVQVPFLISGEKRGAHAAGRNTDYSALRLPDRARPVYPDSAYLQCVVPTHHHDSVNKAWRGIVTCSSYKYVCFENTDWLLFDLNEDPCELVNLAHNDKYLPLRKQLREELQRWIEKTNDTFSLPEL